jgi:glyoxylase-like metal-dependent hydrolase (beta-lactamase superfamily II)
VSAVPAVVERYGWPVWAHAETAAALASTIAIARTLGDGDVLPLGTSPDGQPGWTLEAMHTPGHSRGHLAFRESRYGAILAGDLVSTVSTIMIAPPDGHLATYLASLARLRALPCGTLYPAHGPAKRDSHAVLDAYVAHRAERERKVRAALGPEPRWLDEILPRAYDDVPPSAGA